MARRRMVVGAIVVVALIGAGAFLLTRGEGGIEVPFVDEGPPTPELAFDRVRIAAVPTSDTPGADIDVEQVGGDAQTLVTEFYQQVWIDPDVWEGGDYAGVFDEVMSGEVIEAAQQDLEALTLGPDAGATYAFVTPGRSKLSIEVITNASDEPTQMMAQVTFTATAEHTDGTFTDIEQTATYFIADMDGDWRIISFDASRREQAGEAPPSPTPSAEATS